MRPEVTETNEGMSSKEVTAEVARMWKDLDKEGKNMYNEQAREEAVAAEDESEAEAEDDDDDDE